MFKRLVKNTTLLSSGTFLSRILGLIRDIVIAKYFGTSAALEAFIAAFKIPNLLRSLLGEGFSDSVATPVFSEYRKDQKKIKDLGSKTFSLFVILLLIFTFLGIILAPFLITITALGFLKDPYKFNLAVKFSRGVFFYLFFIGLVALFNSFFYVRKKFFLPAFLPLLFNLFLIFGILFFKKYLNGYILVLSVLVSAFLQFVISFFFLRFKEKIILKIVSFKEIFKDRDISRMIKLFFPRIWSSIVYQLSVFVDTNFSSLSWIVGEGALAAIYYANRIIQFPLALIAVSLSRVAIVDFSYLYKEKRYDEFKQLFLFSFKSILFFILPFSMILIFVGNNILEVLFKRGAFGDYSLNLTSWVLFFYSFGLFFFCGIKLLVNSFYALKDTITPARSATFALIINVVLSAFLIFPLKIGGVALASTLAAAFNFFYLLYKLNQQIGKLLYWNELKGYLLKLIFLSIISALFFKSIFIFGEYNKYIKLLLAILAGTNSFLIGGSLLKIEQIIFLKKWICRRR